MSGTVYLVGAGPGDPGLITRRALDLIAEADVILYDRLIPSGALDAARPDADLRYVGKRPGAPKVSQEELNRRLIELARAGQSVVRLKGGGPFVFGRRGRPRPGSSPPPSRSSGTWPVCATSSPGSSAARFKAGRWSSPARALRRASLQRGSARSAPRRSRRRRSGSSRARARSSIAR